MLCVTWQLRTARAMWHSFALLEQARILLRQNKLEEARGALNTLTQTYPTTPSAMFGGSILADVQA